MTGKVKLLLFALLVCSGVMVSLHFFTHQSSSKFRNADWLLKNWVSPDGFTHFENPNFRRHDSKWERGAGVFGLTINYYELPRQLTWSGRLFGERSECSPSDVSIFLSNEHVQRVTYRRPPNSICDGAFINTVRRKLEQTGFYAPTFDTPDRFGFEVVRSERPNVGQTDPERRVAFAVSDDPVRDFYHLSVACDPARKRYTFAIRRNPTETWVGLDRYYVHFRQGACLDPRHSAGIAAFIQAVMDDSGFR